MILTFPDANNLSRQFRSLRRQGQIHPHVSMSVFHPNDTRASTRIFVSLGSGRVLRPLIITENGTPLVTEEIIQRIAQGELSWKDLLHMGAIDLLDANEEENAFVALGVDSLTKEHSHMELFPASILGATASLIPYPEHNQSPRNTY